MVFRYKYSINARWLSVLCLIGLGVYGCGKTPEGYYGFTNKEARFEGNTLQYLQSKPELFDSLLVVLDRLPEVSDMLAADSTTLFAVPNGSFRAVLRNINLIRASQSRPPLMLSAASRDELDTLISKYILPEIFPTDSLYHTDGRFMESIGKGYTMNARLVASDAQGVLGGGPLSIVYSDTKASDFTRDWSATRTAAVDIKCTNGVVHVLVDSHEFGFGEAVSRLNK